MNMLGAVIVLIALAAWPSVASAHEGHAHSVAPKASIQHELTPREYAEADKPTVQMKIQLKASESSEAPACAGTCCAGAPCGGCIALALVEAAQWGPDLAAASADPSEPKPSFGVTAEGLRKPPRSFT